MVLETWIITIISLLAIPLALSYTKKGFAVGPFLCALSIVIFYNIWVGILPKFMLVFGVMIIGGIFLLTQKGDVNE